MDKEFSCVHCKKEFKGLAGKNGHEPTCKNNPNKINAWNKGLTKETNETVAKYAKSGSITKNSEEWQNDHPAWNIGLTKESNESVAKYSEGCKNTKANPLWLAEHLKRIYEKYDGKHYTQTKAYKKHMKECLFEKYGTSNLMDVPEVADKIIKARYKLKDYVLPSGKVIKIQGYEHLALDVLLKEGILENDIIVDKTNIPKIYYKLNKINHRYYPDIFIKSLNKIIEVKSTYTVSDNKYKNKLKHLASIKAGYLHEVWIFDKNEVIVDKITDLEKYYKHKKKLTIHSKDDNIPL